MQQTDADISAAVIVSTKNIHVWSGGNDGLSQKTQEMLSTVNRWGSASAYNYIVVSASSPRLSMMILHTSVRPLPLYYL